MLSCIHCIRNDNHGIIMVWGRVEWLQQKHQSEIKPFSSHAMTRAPVLVTKNGEADLVVMSFSALKNGGSLSTGADVIK